MSDEPVLQMFEEMTQQTASDMALLADVVVQRDQLLAKLEKVRDLYLKWATATELTTGNPSIVAQSFATELGIALGEPPL